MKIIFILLLTLTFNAHAEKHGCIDENGNPYYSSTPCAQKTISSSSKTNNKYSSITEIKVMEAGYVDIRTITNKEEINRVQELLKVNNNPASKSYIQKEFVLVFKSKTKKSSYWVHEDGSVYYFSKMGSRVTKTYKISEIEKLRKLLIGGNT